MSEQHTAHELDTMEGDDATAQMFSELDTAIKEANKQAISAAAGPITKTDMLRLAVAVSRFRASYLSAALKIGDLTGTEMPSASQFSELQRQRAVYAEGLEGFGALRDAVQRGYVSLVDDEVPVLAE